MFSFSSSYINRLSMFSWLAWHMLQMSAPCMQQNSICLVDDATAKSHIVQSEQFIIIEEKICLLVHIILY